MTVLDRPKGYKNATTQVRRGFPNPHASDEASVVQEAPPIIEGIQHRLAQLMQLQANWGGPGSLPPQTKALQASSVVWALGSFLVPTLPRITPQAHGGVRSEWLSTTGRLWVDVGPKGHVMWGRLLEEAGQDATHDQQALMTALGELGKHLPAEGWLAWASSTEGHARPKVALRGLVFWLESASEAGQWGEINEALKRWPPAALEPSALLTVLEESWNFKHKLPHWAHWKAGAWAAMERAGEDPAQLLGALA